jgi:hypothetical protein
MAMDIVFERRAEETVADWIARLNAMDEAKLSPTDREARAFWVDVAQDAREDPARIPTREEIATSAYYLWEREGCPHGRDQEHWYNAIQEVRARRNAKRHPPHP